MAEPGSKLSDEVVERLARALYDDFCERERELGGAAMTPLQSYETQRAAWRHQAELNLGVLTAALRLDDPETRARLAQTIRLGCLAVAAGKGSYDDVAGAVLRVLGLGAEPEEADGG